ncbi:hypothetical protein NC651_008017 [Populus alba x Populus x berolinensis]|nr:hypothetical protein NC651_008017 [Populus alba x Populus x berolinensis]
MLTLGFSTGSSTQMIMEEANSANVMHFFIISFQAWDSKVMMWWGKKARGKLRSHYVGNDGRVK